MCIVYLPYMHANTIGNVQQVLNPKVGAAISGFTNSDYSGIPDIWSSLSGTSVIRNTHSSNVLVHMHRGWGQLAFGGVTSLTKALGVSSILNGKLNSLAYQGFIDSKGKWGMKPCTWQNSDAV